MPLSGRDRTQIYFKFHPETEATKISVGDSGGAETHLVTFVSYHTDKDSHRRGRVRCCTAGLQCLFK